MPLVRSAAPSAADTPPSDDCATSLARLADDDATMRRRAARALAGDPAAAAAMAARLAVEPALPVRDALFAGLVETGGAVVAGLIAPLLRGDDAALRNGALDALKMLGEGAAPELDRLLGDPDPDVRILAVEVTRAWPSALAVPRLRRVIESDPDVNVCGAAVDVATEVGNGDLIPALGDLSRRFAGEPFLIFSVAIAYARINAADSQADDGMYL